MIPHSAMDALSLICYARGRVSYFCNLDLPPRDDGDKGCIDDFLLIRQQFFVFINMSLTWFLSHLPFLFR